MAPVALQSSSLCCVFWWVEKRVLILAKLDKIQKKSLTNQFSCGFWKEFVIQRWILACSSLASLYALEVSYCNSVCIQRNFHQYINDHPATLSKHVQTQIYPGYNESTF